MFSLTIVGLFKMLLMIVGAFALLRFLGVFMVAKRDISAQNELKRHNEKVEKERKQKLKNFGKISISKKDSPQKKSKNSAVEDVDFVEIIED